MKVTVAYLKEKLAENNIECESMGRFKCFIN
jgi:hypothetical protein